MDHIRGGLAGLIGGLLLGCAVVAIVGRALPSVVAACMLVIAGAVFGALRQSAEGELSFSLLLAGAFCGIVVGAALGGLIGMFVNLAHG